MEWAGLTTHYEGALVTAKPRACNIKAAAAASVIKKVSTTFCNCS